MRSLRPHQKFSIISLTAPAQLYPIWQALHRSEPAMQTIVGAQNTRHSRPVWGHDWNRHHYRLCKYRLGSFAQLVPSISFWTSNIPTSSTFILHFLEILQPVRSGALRMVLPARETGCCVEQLNWYYHYRRSYKYASVKYVCVYCHRRKPRPISTVCFAKHGKSGNIHP